MAGSENARKIGLRILSPALELGDGLNINDVAVDSTVGALKQRLTELVPSHPTPDRMRLIHFGHLLADDDQTLSHLFGDAALHQTSPFTLHLVVRAPPTPMENAATRAPFFAPNPPVNAAAAAPRPNILPPGLQQHPFIRGPTAFIPSTGATATPPHPATPLTATPPSHSPAPDVLQQLMAHHQQQVREMNRSLPLPSVANPLAPATHPPNPPASAPVASPPHLQHHTHPHHQPQPGPHTHNHPHHHSHPQPQPHQHTTITFHNTTMAMPMPFGPNNLPMGQRPLPGFQPLQHQMNHLHHAAPRPHLHQFNIGNPNVHNTPIVYLVSSPQAGPQALLLSPQGTFTADLATHMPSFPLAQTHPRHAPATQLQEPVPEQPPVVNPPQVPEQAVQQLPQQGNQGAQGGNQEADVLAPWQPLLAQAWMLLRVLFFAWFFLGTGQGWRRPILLAVTCLVFWFVSAGGLGTTVRDVVRSWWEGVVGLPQRNDAQQPGQNQPAVQQHGAIRQILRPAERALALFVASLWPGIGERTVTARREQEERQRREEQDRQRAEEENRQRQLEASQSTSQEDPATPAGEAILTPNESVASGTAVATATGANVTPIEQEVRERKAAPSHQSTVEDSAE